MAAIIQFLTSQNGAILLGCLLAVSEYLGTTSRFESSSIFQVIVNGLKWLAAIAAPKSDTQPPAPPAQG